MKSQFDVIVIGSGTAGYTCAYPCASAGKKVAVVDSQPFGGTCAMRGCQPKKYLVAAAEAVERASGLVGKGIRHAAQIQWADLIRQKNIFTHAVPGSTEAGFKAAGMTTIHGHARFTGPTELRIQDQTINADCIVIATGAIPKPLRIPGEELIVSSDRFMELTDLPDNIVFIGGGYISFEFAHVAARNGCNVTILHRSERLLKRFESSTAAELVKATKDAGINLHTNAPVKSVEQIDDKFCVTAGQGKALKINTDLVVHGAGRIADVQSLALEKAHVDFNAGGVRVNPFMQSISNPAVYAVGDAADTPFQLATTADMEAEVAADNIMNGNRVEADYTGVASVVFTQPPLASVGMDEKMAEEKKLKFRVNTGDMSGWPSSVRIGQKHAVYKVLIEEKSNRILGAHILGHNADEAINIFAMATIFNLTTDDLKKVLWAYPTYTSDTKYMIR